MRSLNNKYLMKSVENCLHLKRRLYRFQLKNKISIREHMNNYMKLLADLANVDKVIQDEDKALILLSSLLNDEYETFVLILINAKQSLSDSELSVALVNHALRRKEESSNSTSAAMLAARGIGFNHWKGKGDLRKFKTYIRELKKNQCAFCKGHEKVDCLKLNKKNGSKSEANITQVDDDNDRDLSGYSLFITPTVCYSDLSGWILNTGATYHVYPKGSSLASRS